jgi:hypothetical protein
MADSNVEPGPPLTEAVDPDLYPDLIRLGGLASAMSDVAQRVDADLGQVGVHSPAGRFNSVLLDSDRGTISVLLGAEKRLFDINIYGEAYPWARGATDDLTAAVQVADAWRRGATLRELAARFPFMTYDSLSEAYEDGDPGATQWRRLLDDRDLEPLQDLLRAAHANDELRALFPFVSHNTLLRFVSDPTDRSGGELWITQEPQGTYRVESTARSGSQRAVDSVDEAIEAALSYLH